MKLSNYILIYIFSLLISPLFAKSAFAFYNWQGENSSLEARGLLSIYGLAINNPEENFFYTTKNASGIGEQARLIVDGQIGHNFNYNINLLQSYLPDSLLFSKAESMSIERSARLHWQFSDEDLSQLEVDQLNIGWSQGRIDLKLGRQPVNLATTFYFTPNDFFSPFSAQTFYRVYKPGVDAARAEIRLGDLSQLSFISVLGYKRDPNGDTGWSDNSDFYRTSHLLRISTVKIDTEWALIAGRVREENIIGASIQGEVASWLGIRAEGHLARARVDSSKDSSEFSIGLEHRWENSLQGRLELFYHGNGVASEPEYASKLADGKSHYLANRYSALGLSYEFTHLLICEGLLMTNHIDHSQLFSINAVYSLADETDLTFNINIPYGDKPDGDVLKSEFGFYPKSVSIAVRTFF